MHGKEDFLNVLYQNYMVASCNCIIWPKELSIEFEFNYFLMKFLLNLLKPFQELGMEIQGGVV